MTNYFIDTENIGKQWIEIIKKVGKDSRIFLFATEKSCSCSMLDLKFIVDASKKGNIEVIACKNGTKNALDFALTLQLGKITELYPGEKNYIVSSDHDYDCITGSSIKRISPTDVLSTANKPVKIKGEKKKSTNKVQNKDALYLAYEKADCPKEIIEHFVKETKNLKKSSSSKITRKALFKQIKQNKQAVTYYQNHIKEIEKILKIYS